MFGLFGISFFQVMCVRASEKSDGAIQFGVMSRTSDKEMLLRLVPESGDSVGNLSVLRQLGWDEEKYWRVRDELLSDGVLIRGRGQGGSIRRPSPEQPKVEAGARTPKAQAPAEQASRTFESDLYEPLLRVLSTDWIREMRIESDQIHFEITARQGKKATGGTWTRPDITAISVRTFQHLPNKYLDIWTFEAKAAEWLDVTAVFEAAAHGSRATRSYALLQVPDNRTSRVEDVLERCEREATRLRVGLITFTRANDFATFETRVEAPRVDTDPESLEDFISQLSDAAKKRLARWK